jgi:hypothetical protein
VLFAQRDSRLCRRISREACVENDESRPGELANEEDEEDEEGLTVKMKMYS